MNKLVMMIGVAAVALGAMPAMAEALKTAYWTGGGDRANVNDPANWVVTNSLGVVVENGIPDVETAVVISGETDFNCPFGQTLDYESLIIGDCTLTADCDWRGLVLRPSPAYIDVPKDAYIDTGFKPNQNTRVVPNRWSRHGVCVGWLPLDRGTWVEIVAGGRFAERRV